MSLHNLPATASCEIVLAKTIFLKQTGMFLKKHSSNFTVQDHILRAA
jgi:hypothetical protein